MLKKCSKSAQRVLVKAQWVTSGLQIHRLNNLSGSKKVKTTNGIDEDAEHFYDLNAKGLLAFG